MGASRLREGRCTCGPVRRLRKGMTIMAKGLIYIYAGDGRGKSPAAIGRAVQAAVEGKHVVFLQFLKGKGQENSDFLRRM